MLELTPEDREQILNQITEFKEQQIIMPAAPDGQLVNEALDKAIQSQAIPDRKENKRIVGRIKSIWSKWRNAALDAKSLEVEKIACQIKIEQAKTQQQLAEIRRQEELAEANHWLALNKGNLEDIDANTTSKPSMFWYALRRGFHHITKLTTNIPKIIRNLFWIGIAFAAILALKHYNIIN